MQTSFQNRLYFVPAPGRQRTFSVAFISFLAVASFYHAECMGTHLQLTELTVYFLSYSIHPEIERASHLF